MATRRKPKKKKSPAAAVAIGSAVSMTVIALIFVAFWVKSQPGSGDSASSSSSQANLEKQTLPDDMPTFGVTTGGGKADTAAFFMKLDEVKGIMRAGGFEEEKKQKSKELYEEMKKLVAGKPWEGYIDSRIPDKQFMSDDVKQAMSVVGKAVGKMIEDHMEMGEFDQAREIAAVHLAFGKQVYDNNIRLKAREIGLATMRSSLSKMQQIITAELQEDVITREEWDKKNEQVLTAIKAIEQLEDRWQAKLENVDSVNQKEGIPNIADLVAIANNDKDRTFRVWAALRLGYALYERGDPGNQKKINEALDALEQSDDALVASAAKSGRSIKDADEYHQLRRY